MDLCKKLQLSNGMTLLMIPNRQSPVVAIQGWMRFGAADESDDIAGLAHLFEHLLFKGTERRAVGQVAAEIEGLGGDVNAYTSYDQTVMHMTLPSKNLEKGLDILSDCLMNSIVDEEELLREKQVVLEEIKRRNDQPSAIVFDEFQKLLFPQHPYSRPVIGFASVVENMSRDRILDLYKKYYNTKTVFLVIAGDFEESTLIELCEKYFKKLRSGSLTPQRSIPLAVKTAQGVYKNHPSPNAIYYYGWQTPHGTHSDVAALDALAFILGQGESSRLTQELVNDKALLRGISASCWTPKDAGSFSIYCRGGVGTAKDHTKILTAIRDCMAKPILSSELEKAKKNLLSDAIFTKETVDGMAQRFGYSELLGDIAFDSQYLEAVRALSVESVEQVKSKYLDWNKVSSTGIFPEKETLPDFKKSLAASESKALPVKSSTELTKVETFQHNGLKVIVRTLKHLPVFSTRWVGLGGARLEPSNKPGLGSLWSRTVLNGGIGPDGKVWSLEDLGNELDVLSADLGAMNGKNSFSYSLDGLSEDFERLFPVLLATLRKPTFEKEHVEKDKKRMLMDIQSAKDNPSIVAGKLFSENLFGKHPYGRSSLGNEKSIRSLNVKNLTAFHTKLLAQPQVLCIVGNIESSQVKALLKKHLPQTKFFKNSSLSKTKAPLYVKKAVTLRQKLKKEQTHLLMGFPTVNMKHKDRWALTAIGAVLSGQGGRLFLELRDKLSLCYTVTPNHMEALDGGYFAFYIACSPEKEETAITALKREIERLVKDGVSPEEWQRALNFYIGNYQIEQQRMGAQSMGMALDELYGLGYQEYFKFEEALLKLKPSDLQNAAKKYLDYSGKKPQVLAVVGPRA